MKGVRKSLATNGQVPVEIRDQQPPSFDGLCALRVLLCQGLDRTGLEPVFTGGRKGRGGLTRRGRSG
jgi:hypothetical protein